MIGLMFYLEWDFTLIALAVTPFMLLFVGRLKRAVKTATVEVRKKQAQVIAVATQGLGAERSIQAFDRQDLESRRMMAISYETVMAALKARAYKALMSPIVSIIVAGCTGVVLWLGTKQVLAGAMTVGGLTVFLAYLKQFFSPVKDLATMSNTIAQTTVSLERIYDILDSDDMIPEKPDAKLPPKAMKGEIVFEDVAFAYEPDNPILRGVSFTVKPGQMVGVVGSTGSGKSTIASLIPRFYDPTQGTVKIDGTDVRDFQLHPLRQQIGFVLQETVLFKGTIRENIAYGRRDEVSDEEIIEAAKLANAHEFIVQMPAGYNTPVGDRGDTMSGGQRQRIGIARAMIRNNPIMILDEPTAALDTQSEKAVMEGLRSLIKGRTAITIAHRLSTIREADNIIALDKGVIIEQGTHQELMTLNGFYANLYRIQFPDEGASPTASAAPATTSA
ncbi:unnamed protein product [Darwinula stevensoni]|uniref:ABC transporter ATP-binding protein n=1 Tax=Darwinula stevensoni TaxID=69355 RepID=A0A7R9FTG2_9CRUS|nr:unnamed protein product [Darwinula stevensoni]CAG0906065.1 unnamed protein product [Darwinula stevensoni]